MTIYLAIGSVIVAMVEVMLSNNWPATFLAFLVIFACGYMFGLLKLQRYQSDIKRDMENLICHPGAPLWIRKYAAKVIGDIDESGR